MVKKKRGPGRPRKRGRPKGSKNKIITGLEQAIVHAASLEYVKDYSETASFRSRLEAATIKYEQAINAVIEQLTGK